MFLEDFLAELTIGHSGRQVLIGVWPHEEREGFSRYLVVSREASDSNTMRSGQQTPVSGNFKSFACLEGQAVRWYGYFAQLSSTSPDVQPGRRRRCLDNFWLSGGDATKENRLRYSVRSIGPPRTMVGDIPGRGQSVTSGPCGIHTSCRLVHPRREKRHLE